MPKPKKEVEKAPVVKCEVCKVDMMPFTQKTNKEKEVLSTTHKCGICGKMELR